MGYAWKQTKCQGENLCAIEVECCVYVCPVMYTRTQIIRFYFIAAIYSVLTYTSWQESTVIDVTESTVKFSDEPHFDLGNITTTVTNNVTVIGVVGRSVQLKCKVQNLGNKTISWIRHRDIHILTVGGYTYTSDQRFKAIYNHSLGECTLELKWTSMRDEGDYECQISTQPVRSLHYHLKVVVPHAVIWDGPEIYVEKGSMINITCSINYSSEPPAFIFWFHHDDVINFDSARGGVSVITEKAEVTISHLLIQKADLADSGRYSCSPSNADVASVRVHVVTGT